MRHIRKSKLAKVVAVYLSLQLVISIVQPSYIYALTGGPSQPEFNSFTPIGTSDMVSLTSGNFNYNIPIMDVGGYPLNLAYDSGVTMDQEASWVGLGWNLNVGQINRQIRGIPDDFDGDEITYENNTKPNLTVGVGANVNAQAFGIESLGLNVGGGVTAQYNNYQGVSVSTSRSFSFNMANTVNVGMSLNASAIEGVSISPNLSLSTTMGFTDHAFQSGLSANYGVGITYNSRQGLSSLNLQSSMSLSAYQRKWDKKDSSKEITEDKNSKKVIGLSGSGKISYLTNTFTPTKRVPYVNKNYTFAFSYGGDFWGIDGEIGGSAFGSYQKIDDDFRSFTSKAYGYENTEHATNADVLDFNRENDKVVNKNTRVLPVLNYTHDIYSINGQGIGGMFRPFKSQVGYVYDPFVQDVSSSLSLGGEAEAGTGVHVGLDITDSPSVSNTGVWNTVANQYFEKSENNDLLYEPTYYQLIGEMSVDEDLNYQTLNEEDPSTLNNVLVGGKDPISLDIMGNSSNKKALNVYRQKTEIGQLLDEHANIPIHDKIKRESRAKRNTSIQKFSVEEAIDNNDPFIMIDGDVASNANLETIDPKIKPHHTAAYKLLQPGGTRYIYGETAYNWTKKETTFAVNQNQNSVDCTKGLVEYGSSEDGLSNSSGNDHLYNGVTTPSYAHTFLLSSILSADYEDLTGDGVSDDDLGAYTKFNYVTKNSNYKWRVPFQYRKATYNEGLKTLKKDQKGNYIYGEKELKYIRYIETKTHVAVFSLKPRKDGYGVSGKDGGRSNSAKMYRLHKIELYSKPELNTADFNIIKQGNGNLQNISVSPIKTAFFEYNYSLCKNLPNHIEYDPEDLENEDGKLTLSKVYFTYKDSHMGKYTPYTFNYSNENPDYGVKDYNVWGNYKKNQGGCRASEGLTAPEFPFVEQDKTQQDRWSQSWSLANIKLPSGGEINVEYESDDYKYVQNKKAMRMFKDSGAGNSSAPSSSAVNRTKLFSGSTDYKYLYVKLDEQTPISNSEFRRNYLGVHANKPIYFRFLLNMTKAGQNSLNSEYDYVSGYFNIRKNSESLPEVNVFQLNNEVYAAIAMEFLDLEGGVNGNKKVNPISKAGWYFGRKYMNKVVYGFSEGGGVNVEDIARQLMSTLANAKEILFGPNARLRNDKMCARNFASSKSWIRLQNGDKNKLGGGSRVKSVKLSDNWGPMVKESDADARYNQKYGQTYSYTLTDGTSSSGVASYEPLGSHENPFVEPFYNDGERLTAPKETNYVEKPFGQSFFPSPTVTYSRVEVKSILPEDYQESSQTFTNQKSGTGKTVKEFYTTKDFPTITDHTSMGDLDGNYYTNANDAVLNSIKSLLNADVSTMTELALSQGFVVRTNDMNGKPKSEKIYNESGNLISGIDYKYKVSSTNSSELDNVVKVIGKDGVVKDKEIGVQYDIINDFRKNYSKTEVFGVQTNVAIFTIGIFPIVIPTVFSSRADHETVYKGTSTTKVIHTTAILEEKVAYDLGARVSTKNLAWSEDTGEVLLTETNNEYNDTYYTFNFPARWNPKYENMGRASKNIGLKGRMRYNDNAFKLSSSYNNTDISQYLRLGDEIILSEYVQEFGSWGIERNRCWVVDYNADGSGVVLMDREGNVLNYSSSILSQFLHFEVVRSGYRNQQNSSMASITLMKNPLDNDLIEDSDFYVSSSNSAVRVINASAVEFTDFWAAQCEANLPYTYFTAGSGGEENYSIYDICEYFPYNPYVFNIKGDYKPKRSYAFLTGRSSASSANLQHEGFFTSFTPYYIPNEDGDAWVENLPEELEDWTFASEVTQYSPYGAELENRDALGRYSSAQYGYHYTLPTAVASNSSYGKMGYDGFEDYEENTIAEGEKHFSFQDGEEANGEEIDLNDLTEKEAHTGRKSIIVLPNSNIKLTKNLEDCEE